MSGRETDETQPRHACSTRGLGYAQRGGGCGVGARVAEYPNTAVTAAAMPAHGHYTTTSTTMESCHP